MININSSLFFNGRVAGFPLRPIAAGVIFVLISGMTEAAIAADSAIEFNTDVLDVKDRSNIDLSQFSRAGYIMPGEYVLAVRVNKSALQERAIKFFAPDSDPDGSEPCFTPEIIHELGLKAEAEKELVAWHGGQCLSLTPLNGVTVRGDLGNSAIYVNMPQAYLEYTSENWDPPARWDEGVPGVLFDYSVNAQTVHQQSQSGSDTRSVSGNGVAGANLGPWRMRADWQAQYNHSGSESTQNLNWSSYYAYRAISALRAKLTLGEGYLSSGMFDSFRYLGGSLVSDDNMLPPNLRGYAPEVTGVAKTNAKVTISQQGRVLYETTVAAGPFRIQDLNNAVSGKLDVKVEEQDGSVSTFQMDTANIPYLTRPGMVRYKFALGRPSTTDHKTSDLTFANGEFSWGVNNGWSLYGGGLGADGYTSAAVGVGRDLLALGAISVDMTQSRAELPEEGTKSGGSYRVSYSKRFAETDSQITFAGYRFSERNFMNMSQYINRRFYSQSSANLGGGKELYTLTFNQQLRELNSSVYLSYNHQTYWDRPTNDNYSLSVAHYFDLGRLKNLSVNGTAFRNKYNDNNDDGIYMSLSIPWGNSGTLSYDASANGSSNSQSLRYNDRIDDNTSYNVATGVTDGQGSGSGYITHLGDKAEVSGSASVQNSEYASLSMSVRGGMTATAHGAALHRTGIQGGTRMMVDTAGVSDVPVQGYNAVTNSNIFGKAVVSDVSSYYRNTVSVNLDKLGDNVEATRSVVEGTLTEGAIGYRKFGLIAGQKAMGIVKLADGTTPPFGATVLNKDGQQTGLLNDEGSVWLSGIVAGETMTVNWDGIAQCSISLPDPLPENISSNVLLLPCKLLSSEKIQ
ncbi:outer membrane usher protein [Dryocola sp. BD626]|uniref:outer membrane usher protein n=1 Tax=Dryocola sp. BD626 TaxID=3133273 RepID=UPI003F4FE9E0